VTSKRPSGKPWGGFSRPYSWRVVHSIGARLFGVIYRYRFFSFLFIPLYLYMFLRDLEVYHFFLKRLYFIKLFVTFHSTSDNYPFMYLIQTKRKNIVLKIHLVTHVQIICLYFRDLGCPRNTWITTGRTLFCAWYSVCLFYPLIISSKCSTRWKISTHLNILNHCSSTLEERGSNPQRGLSKTGAYLDSPSEQTTIAKVNLILQCILIQCI
jgi:hypothetical protein